MLFPPDKENAWEKFLYFGLPGWAKMDNPEAPEVAGIAARVMSVYFNGMLFMYSGSFTKAFFKSLGRQ